MSVVTIIHQCNFQINCFSFLTSPVLEVGCPLQTLEIFISSTHFMHLTWMLELMSSAARVCVCKHVCVIVCVSMYGCAAVHMVHLSCRRLSFFFLTPSRFVSLMLIISLVSFECDLYRSIWCFHIYCIFVSFSFCQSLSVSVCLYFRLRMFEIYLKLILKCKPFYYYQSKWRNNILFWKCGHFVYLACPVESFSKLKLFK